MINTTMMNKPFKAPQNVKKPLKPFDLSTKPEKSLIPNKITSKIGAVSLSSTCHHSSASNCSSNNSTISNSSKYDHLINKNKVIINKANQNTSGQTANLSSDQSRSNVSDLSRSSEHNGSSLSNQSTVDINYPCQLCELNFYNIDRLSFHLVKIHKLDKRINLVQCYVDGCEQKFSKRMQLVDHLNDFHNLGIVVIRKIVDSLDEFTKWKEKTEKETGYKWIQNNSFFLNHRLRKTFICNRPATNGSKIYSLHGLTTINNHSTFCLSSIKITENEDGSFFIEFIETHNHDAE